MLHEFFINICNATAYSEKYTYKASQNLNTFKSVVSVGVLCRFWQEGVIIDLSNSLGCGEFS